MKNILTMKYLQKFKMFENNSPLLELSDNVDSELIYKIRGLISNGKILEISCGNGSDSIELSKLGFDVTATDTCDDYVKYVNSKGVKCINHDTSKKLPFNDNEFDLIYSRLGLHYFTKEELELIFEELSRITKKYLVFTVKLVNDIPTGKVILDDATWKNLVSNNFDIIESNIKEGILYNNQSKWLEIFAKKK